MKQILLLCALVPCLLTTAPGGNALSESITSLNQEWQELTGQIGKGVTGGRFKNEALDQQALILAGDRDPLDIVLRRTHALIRHFMRDEKFSRVEISSIENEWNSLSAGAKAVEATPISPPSGTAQPLFQEPPAKSKFLAI